MSHVVRPETVTIPISNGNNITVRKRLNVGEERERLKLFTDSTGTPIPFEHGIATAASYLLDWTLKDDDGNKLEITEKDGTPKEPKIIKKVLDALYLDTFREVREAVEAHIEAMEKAREEEKKAQTSDNNGLATSSSPRPVAGLSSTSVN